MAPHTEGEKLRVAELYVAGASYEQIQQETGVHRTTVWTWRTTDTEFQGIVGELLGAAKAAAAQRLETLGDLAVDAFERGLRSTHRQQVVKYPESHEIVDLQDDSLAVKTADIVTRRIPELMPRQGVDVDVDASDHLVSLIRSLDARRNAGPEPERAGPAGAPPGPTPVRPDKSVDPHEA